MDRSILSNSTPLGTFPLLSTPSTIARPTRSARPSGRPPIDSVPGEQARPFRFFRNAVSRRTACGRGEGGRLVGACRYLPPAIRCGAVSVVGTLGRGSLTTIGPWAHASRFFSQLGDARAKAPQTARIIPPHRHQAPPFWSLRPRRPPAKDSSCRIGQPSGRRAMRGSHIRTAGGEPLPFQEPSSRSARCRPPAGVPDPRACHHVTG